MNDWSYMVIQLRKVFGSARQVARVMQYKNPDYLGRLVREEITDPPYSVGNGIVELYQKYCDSRVPKMGDRQQNLELF